MVISLATSPKANMISLYNFPIVKIPACLICLGKLNFPITSATDRPYNQQMFLFAAVPFFVTLKNILP